MAYRRARKYRIVAIMFIAIGILINQWTLVLLSSDREFGDITRVRVLIFEVCMIGIGLVILVSRGFRVVVIGVYILAAAILLTEVFLRIFDPVGIGLYRKGGTTYREIYAPDPHCGYTHKPGYCGELSGVMIRINGEGFRGEEFEIKKPPGTRRLLLLGDSVVFGWGAPEDSILSAFLQRMFDAEQIPCEVISAGVWSWNTRCEYEFLINRGLEYGPDVIVLVAVPNDVRAKTLVKAEDGRERLSPEGRPAHDSAFLGGMAVVGAAVSDAVDSVINHSYALTMIQQIWLRRGLSEELVMAYSEDSPEWRDAKAALLGIIDVCRSENLELISYLYGDFTSDFSRSFRDAYGGVFRRQGIPCYEFPEEMFRREYWVSRIDRHCKPAGHMIMAEDVFRVAYPAVVGSASPD